MFKNLALIHSITLPVGINHITKDISKVCSLSLEESKIIRNNIDFSFEKNSNLFDENDYLKQNYFTDSNFRKISQKLISSIIKSRLDEILEIIKKHITFSGFNFALSSNFLLTGGGSNLLNLEKYFDNFFGTNIKKIKENNSNNNITMDLEKNFLACLGALKIVKDGWETEAIPETDGKNIEKIGFFDKIFGRRLKR